MTTTTEIMLTPGIALISFFVVYDIISKERKIEKKKKKKIKEEMIDDLNATL